MHIVNRPKKRKTLDMGKFLIDLGVAKAPKLNIKPAYSLWFAAGLYQHLKGQTYVKVQKTITAGLQALPETQ